MKFRRQLAALVAVAMMIGCMPGFVFATETEESQIPTEESEQTEEVQEDQPSDPVVTDEEESEEEIIETIEVTEEYSVEPAYADGDVITIDTWDQLYSSLTNPVDGAVYQLTADIEAPSSASRITLFTDASITIDLNDHYIDMSDSASSDYGYFLYVGQNMNVTITNGSLKGGHSIYDAGMIENYGYLYLENVTLEDNTGKYGAIRNNKSSSTLILNDVTITNNTSSEKGAGVYNNGVLYVQGRIIIEDNYRVVSSSVSYPSNLFLVGATVIRIQDEGVTSDSVIYVDSENLPGAVTYGWNGAANYSVFHFDNRMDAQLREIHDGLEVFGVLNYVNRTWDETDGIVETQETVNTPVSMGLSSGAAINSGFYYVYEDTVVSGLIQIATDSEVSVILADGVSVSYLQGIRVPFSSTLNIYTQGNDSGTLTATGSRNCAGIGGSDTGSCGTVNIYGGTINATGDIAAGIGGGTGTGISRINIYGGNVNATGSGGGNAIGLGSSSASESGRVRIAGGYVTLTAVAPFIYSTIDLELPNMCVSKGNVCCLVQERYGACFIGSTAYSLHIFPCEHNYVDGACSLCGHRIETETPRFIGHSVQLSGDIGLQFFMTLPNGVNPQDCSVTFQGNNIDTTEEYIPTRSDKPGYTSYMVQLDLSSIQLADRFTPTLHYVDSEGEHTLTGSSYCVMDFINWGVTQSDSVITMQEKAILRSLADYGYYSQIYMSAQNGWTYGVDYASVNLGRPPIGQDWEDIEDYSSNYAIVSNIDSAVFSSVTFSMRFADRLSLRVIFKPADGVTIDTSKFNVGGNYDYTISRLSGGRYAVTITGISVRDIDDATNITYDGSSNSVSVSPLSYVYAMMCQEDHDAGKYLVCALANYAAACGFIPTNTGN